MLWDRVSTSNHRLIGSTVLSFWPAFLKCAGLTWSHKQAKLYIPSTINI